MDNPAVTLEIAEEGMARFLSMLLLGSISLTSWGCDDSGGGEDNVIEVPGGAGGNGGAGGVVVEPPPPAGAAPGDYRPSLADWNALMARGSACSGGRFTLQPGLVRMYTYIVRGDFGRVEETTHDHTALDRLTDLVRCSQPTATCAEFQECLDQFADVLRRYECGRDSGCASENTVGDRRLCRGDGFRYSNPLEIILNHRNPFCGEDVHGNQLCATQDSREPGLCVETPQDCSGERCEGDVSYRCSNSTGDGSLVRTDCARYGLACQMNQGRPECMKPDPNCGNGGVGWYCDGDVFVGCAGPAAQWRTQDCSLLGEGFACGQSGCWPDDGPPTCYDGMACDGSVVEMCFEQRRIRFDCSGAYGAVCHIQDGQPTCRLPQELPNGPNTGGFDDYDDCSRTCQEQEQCIGMHCSLGGPGFLESCIRGCWAGLVDEVEGAETCWEKAYQLVQSSPISDWCGELAPPDVEMPLSWVLLKDISEPYETERAGVDVCGAWVQCESDPAEYVPVDAVYERGGGTLCEAVGPGCQHDNTDINHVLDEGNDCHFADPYVSLGWGGRLSLGFDRDLRGCSVSLAIVETPMNETEEFQYWVCDGPFDQAGACLDGGPVGTSSGVTRLRVPFFDEATLSPPEGF